MQNKLIIKLFLIFSLVCNNSFAYTIFYYSYYDNLIINTNKINNNPITTNTTTITTNYDETTIANKLTSNNINIRTGNNLNSVSTIINDTTIDTVDTLINLNNIKLDIGNGIGIAVAEEKHEHEHIHDTWGGDIGRAALGGAITGLASGIGIKGGEFLGDLAGNAFSDLVSSSLSKSTTQVLTASVNASVNAATISTMNTIGTAMSNTTIYGGNFKDVLSAGRDSVRDKDNLKSIAVSTLGAGITSGLSKYIDGASGGIISKGTMQGASFKDQTFSALLENGLSNSVNVALESSINGDSFKESLKRQGLNMLSGTIEILGSRQIGLLAHDRMDLDSDGNIAYTQRQINKPEQLILHAGLGAVSSKIAGGDYLSGAVAGVTGELAGEYFKNKGYNRDDGSELAGLVSGLSSIIVSKSQGKDIDDISTNAYVGQRIGENAAKNNSFGTTTIPACSIGGPAGCAAGVVIDTGIIIGGALLAAYSGAKLEELVRNYSNNSNNKNSENNNSSSSSNINNNVNNTSGASSSSASSGGMMPEDPNDKDNNNGDKNKNNDSSQKGSDLNPKSFENDAEHVFGDKNLEKHKLKNYLDKYNGNKVEALKDIEKATIDYVKQNGVTPEFLGNGAPININGTTIYVRGRIIDGVVRIGTAFIP